MTLYMGRFCWCYISKVKVEIEIMREGPIKCLQVLCKYTVTLQLQ